MQQCSFQINNNNFNHELKQIKHNMHIHLSILFNKTTNIKKQKQMCDIYINLINNDIEYNQKQIMTIKENINETISKILHYIDKKSDIIKEINGLNWQLKQPNNNKFFINILMFEYIYKSSSDDTCCICYENCINTTTITCPQCKKSFHKVCIERWIVISSNKTCAHCVSNIWNKYKIDMDDEIALFNVQLLNNENVLLSSAFIEFKKIYDANEALKLKIACYDQKINNAQQLFNNYVTVFKNYKKITAMFNKTKMHLSIIKNGFINGANMLYMPKIEQKIKDILANDAYNVFFVNRYICSNIFDNFLISKQSSCVISKICLKEIIKKYDHNFVNYITYDKRPSYIIDYIVEMIANNKYMINTKFIIKKFTSYEVEDIIKELTLYDGYNKNEKYEDIIRKKLSHLPKLTINIVLNTLYPYLTAVRFKRRKFDLYI